MALGMFLSLFVVMPSHDTSMTTLQFVYMGIYIFFVIGGGGRYSFDGLYNVQKVSD